MGENVAAVKAADRSREVPEMADSSCVVPEQGSKRAAPEEGMSDRPVKRVGCAPRCKSLASAFACHDSSNLFVGVDTPLLITMLILACLAWGL
jgi:hypothetical protein